MSQEKPTDDPRNKTDEKTMKQTDKPWQQPVEKEQAMGNTKPDLEKWQKSKTS